MFRTALERAIDMNSRVKRSWQDQDELRSIIDQKISVGNVVLNNIPTFEDKHLIFLAKCSLDLAQLEGEYISPSTNCHQKKLGRLEEANAYLEAVGNKTVEVNKLLDFVKREKIAVTRLAPEEYQFKVIPTPPGFRCKMAN